MPPKLLGCTCHSNVSLDDGGAVLNPEIDKEPDHGGQTYLGDPINIATGNMFYGVTDYHTAGQNPLSFTRYYNSRGAGYYELGANWRSNFDRNLIAVTIKQELVIRPSGQILTFNLIGGVWTPDSDVDISLTKSGTTWTLTDADDTVEVYTGSTPYLSTITARNGYRQTLTYAADAQYPETVTDSYGRVLTLTYNPNGLLASVATPDGTTVSYGYTLSQSGYNLTSVTYPTATPQTITYVYGNTTLLNALTSIIDENSNQYISWTYDVYGRALTEKLAGGDNTFTFAYNDVAGKTTVTNAFGVVDTYTFTTLQGVPKVTQISRAATPNTSSSSATAAAAKTFTYDSDGYMASRTDWNGNETTYTNNSHGLPTTINEAVGSSAARTTTIAYDPTWVHMPDTVATPGVTVSFTYDSEGEPLTRKLTDTTTTTVPYSTGGQTRTWTNGWSDGLLASTKNPNNNTTSFGYSSTGALISITDPLSHVTSITSYTGGGLPLTVVDPNSVTTTLTYDGRQRLLTSVVDTAGGDFPTSRTYYNNGAIGTTWPDGTAFTTVLDPAHRPLGYWDNSLATHEEPLNAVGGAYLSVTLDPSNNTTYRRDLWTDALGRRTFDTSHQTGASWQYSYDRNGNLLTITDPLSHVTTRRFDGLNRLSTSTDANSGTVTTTYDAHDRTLTVKDQNGNTTSYVYNGFGDLIQQTSPDTGKTVFHYDADGNLTSKTDALGIVMNQTFDAIDRTLTTTYPADATQNVSYSYDQTGHGFGIGRLTTVTDAAGTLSRTYDERANILTEKRVKGTTTLTTSYTYNSASRLASITYPSGLLVTYMRDAGDALPPCPLNRRGAARASSLLPG